MNSLQKARQLITNYKFPKDLWEIEQGEYYNGENTIEIESLNKKVLAQSLHYLIEIRARNVKEKDVSLGASKQGGAPHFPSLWKCPQDYLFYAQINIADFKSSDIDNHLPDKGIIYFFISEEHLRT